MKRSRFNEEQIIAILKEQEAGMATAEVYRGIRSGHGRTHAEPPPTAIGFIQKPFSPATIESSIGYALGAANIPPRGLQVFG